MRSPPSPSSPSSPDGRQLGAAKTRRISIRIVPTDPLPKPDWIRARAPAPSSRFFEMKDILRANALTTVCEEASCPNIGECFGKGTATFMIMGDKCTRRCPFCDVGHGRPDPLDPAEPARLADTVAALGLNYVVITSVDRDDLRDGGAGHFVACIRAVRAAAPGTRIEVLVPDFRGRLDKALAQFDAAPPDVLNHNIETVPRLYPPVRPGADYAHSLALLARFKARHPDVKTKSGLMVGLGETDDEVLAVLEDLRAHGVDMVTIGQYLAPSGAHLPVRRYVDPDTFARLRAAAKALGFAHAAAGPLVRSSYHADAQHAAADFDAGWLFGASDPPAGPEAERQPFRAAPERAEED
jgi:lipoic acid synthetase